MDPKDALIECYEQEIQKLKVLLGRAMSVMRNTSIEIETYELCREEAE